jgi:two-component system cell cycle response regulator
MGDAVLVEVARRIEGALRRADLLARYGGEEFVALLPATDLQAAVEIAERVRAAVSGLPCAQGALRVTVSLGLAASTPPWSDEIGEGVGEDLLRRADAALFEAKRQGRNRVVGGY